MKHLPPMLKLDGSGWKMSRIPVIEIFGPTIQGEGAGNWTKNDVCPNCRL